MSQTLLQSPETVLREATPELSILAFDEPEQVVSRSRAWAVIVTITSITGIGNLIAGLLTVSIPIMATELNIPESLQLW